MSQIAFNAKIIAHFHDICQVFNDDIVEFFLTVINRFACDFDYVDEFNPVIFSEEIHRCQVKAFPNHSDQDH